MGTTAAEFICLPGAVSLYESKLRTGMTCFLTTIGYIEPVTSSYGGSYAIENKFANIRYGVAYCVETGETIVLSRDQILELHYADVLINLRVDTKKVGYPLKENCNRTNISKYVYERGCDDVNRFFALYDMTYTGRETSSQKVKLIGGYWSHMGNLGITSLFTVYTQEKLLSLIKTYGDARIMNMKAENGVLCSYNYRDKRQFKKYTGAASTDVFFKLLQHCKEKPDCFIRFAQRHPQQYIRLCNAYVGWDILG